MHKNFTGELPALLLMCLDSQVLDSQSLGRAAAREWAFLSHPTIIVFIVILAVVVLVMVDSTGATCTNRQKPSTHKLQSYTTYALII